MNFAGGIDYVPGPYSITMPAGATNASFNVLINDDKIHERDENFTLTINSTSFSDEFTNFGQAVVTIVNDDSKLCNY